MRFGLSRVDPRYLAATDEDIMADLLTMKWADYERRKAADDSFALTARAAEDPIGAAGRLKRSLEQAAKLGKMLERATNAKKVTKIEHVRVRRVKRKSKEAPGG